MRKGTKFQTKKLKKKIPGKRPSKAGTAKVIRKGMRCRSCCWTLWDPSEEDKTAFKDWENDGKRPKEVNYACGQLEGGKESGERHHIQGYSEFIKKMSLSGIKRVHLRKRSLHVERRRGSQTQAIEYTKKKETRVTGPSAWSFEAGKPKRQGVHKDNIKDCVEQIDLGMSMDDIEENFPVQMTLHKNKLIDRFIEKKGQRMLKPCKNNVHIFVGPSGTGKTTTAWSKWPNAYKGVWPTGGRWWWPDYKGQHTIIFDEFRGNISYQQMLALFDIWPMSIEYKGGNTQNVSRHIVVTTVRDPRTWYPGVEDKSELQRRINDNCTIIDFAKGGKYPKFKRKTRQGTFVFDEYVPKFNC
jgi:hypothetical protein